MSIARFISRSNTGTNALSSPAITVSGLQTRSLTYLELVATTVDRGWPACNRHSTISMTDYSTSHCDRTLHAEIIDIPERTRSEQPRDLTTLPTSSAPSSCCTPMTNVHKVTIVLLMTLYCLCMYFYAPSDSKLTVADVIWSSILDAAVVQLHMMGIVSH